MPPDRNRDKVRQAFAARFRAALAELGYSPQEQARLQRLFGVSGQAVRKWAEGLSMPSSSRMPQVAAILGVRRAWLQDGEEPMRPTLGAYSVAEAGIALSEAEVRLLSRFRSLDVEKQAAVSLIVAALAEA